jgi:hypothetical protein
MVQIGPLNFVSYNDEVYKNISTALKGDLLHIEKA